MYVTHTRSSLPVVDYTVVVIVINILWLLCVHRRRCTSNFSKLSTLQSTPTHLKYHPWRLCLLQVRYPSQYAKMSTINHRSWCTCTVFNTVYAINTLQTRLRTARHCSSPQRCSAVDCDKTCIKLLQLFCWYPTGKYSCLSRRVMASDQFNNKEMFISWFVSQSVERAALCYMNHVRPLVHCTVPHICFCTTHRISTQVQFSLQQTTTLWSMNERYVTSQLYMLHTN